MEEKNDKKTKMGKLAKGLVAGAMGVTSLVAVVSFAGCSNAEDNEPQAYTVSISSEFEGFNSTDLTVNKGTKIKDLKSMIVSPVAGYKISGFYKDVACTVIYDEEETITGSSQIYIKFEILKFKVRAFETTSSTEPLEELDVEYMHQAQFKTPIKPSDEYGTYEFTGWTDIRGNAVDVYHITEDMDVYATFRIKEYKYYNITSIPQGVTITRGSEQVENVTTSTLLKYGERVKIVYTVSEGHKMTNFDVAGASKVEGTDGWYEVRGNVTVTYSEEKLAFIVGDIPQQIQIQDANGNSVLKNSQVLWGDELVVTRTPSTGYHETKFETEGLFPTEGLGTPENTYYVRGNVGVTYTEEINTLTVKFYDDDKVTLLESDTVEYGRGATYNVPSKSIDSKIGSYEFTGWVNEKGESVQLSRMIFEGHGNEISVYASYKLNYVEYSVSIPDGVSVSKNNLPVNSETVLHFGDELVVSYSISKGHHLKTFTVDGEAKENGATVVVTGNMTIVFEQEANTATYNFYSEGVLVGTSTVAHGKDVVLPANPSKATENDLVYTFEKWVTEEGGNTAANFTRIEVLENGKVVNVYASYTYEHAYLTFEEYNNGYYVSSLTDNTITEVIIPATYKGRKVTGLNTRFRPFSYNTNLRKVTLQEGIEEIGECSFIQCTALKEIVIPSTVTKIDSAAFSGCSNLTNVTIKSSQIYSLATNGTNAGNLLENATTIRVLATVDDGSNTYLNSNYTKTSGVFDGKNYNIYTKN